MMPTDLFEGLGRVALVSLEEGAFLVFELVDAVRDVSLSPEKVNPE